MPYAYVLRTGVFLVKLGLVGMDGMVARSSAGRRWLCGAVLGQGRRAKLPVHVHNHVPLKRYL